MSGGRIAAFSPASLFGETISMKLSGSYTLTKVLPIFHQVFSWRAIRLEWKHSLRGDYKRQVEEIELIRALIGSYLLRLPNLKVVGRRFSHWTGTQSQSTLSDHLISEKLLKLACQLLQQLSPPIADRRAGHQLIEVIDGMPQTIPL